MAVRLITTGNGFFDLADICIGEITLQTSVRKTPSVLNFKILYNDDIKSKVFIEEGTQLMLYSDEEEIFKGYAFAKEISDGDFLKVTAYDQLRYFSNRDSFYFKDMRASEIVKRICDIFKVKTGEIERTGYIIPLIVCNNMTIWDTIEKALKLDFGFTKEKYVIYDDFGRVVMKNIKNMTAPAIISYEDKGLLGYSIKSSIDENTYNKIKLLKRNRAGEVYITAAEQEAASVNKWGVLQYSEVIEDEINSAMAQNLAKKLLEEKNRVFSQINVTQAENTSLRAGSSVRVRLNGNEEKLFYVKDCIHIFKNREHIMKAQLEDYE